MGSRKVVKFSINPLGNNYLRGSVQASYFAWLVLLWHVLRPHCASPAAPICVMSVFLWRVMLSGWPFP